RLAAAEPASRRLAPQSGARSQALGADAPGGAARASHTGGIALPRPAGTRLQAWLSRRSPLAGRRLSPGNRLGLVHRPLRRRLAQSVSRRRPATVPRRLRPAPGRFRPRDHRGDLRRRPAARGEGLHRAGLERGGVAALLAARVMGYARSAMEAARHASLWSFAQGWPAARPTAAR